MVPGGGLEPVPQNELTAARLAGVLKIALTDPCIRQRAADLGAKMQAEDGVERAVTRSQWTIKAKLGVKNNYP